MDVDDDNDLIPDQFDNCPKISNPGQQNNDSDLLGNACDSDDDNDGVDDDLDCKPLDPKIFPGADEVCDGLDNNCIDGVDEGFPDSNNDGIANCVSDDDDGDGVPDSVDNCPAVKNPEQTNSDTDLIGDACDPDDDNDGHLDEDDCAPTNPAVHPTQFELCDGSDNNCNDLIDEGFLNTDGTGDADCLDTDDDDDGVPDNFDSCPTIFNPDQNNSDTDLLGDACDPDDDNDGTPDALDCAPTNKLIHPAAVEQCDGVDNNCTDGIDEGFPDTDDDGTPDCLDSDDDNDGHGDSQDNCPTVANPGQTNSDTDLAGDACDTDDDNDGTPDELDCAPTNAAIHPQAIEQCDGVDNNCADGIDEGFPNSDNDALADCIDTDDDDDGIPDVDDNCDLVVNVDQLNSDSDQLGDACDTDDDNDGDPDTTDCAPTNPTIHANADDVCDGVDNDCKDGPDTGFVDTDMDGSADCVDPDDDNDLDPDVTDCQPLNAAVHSGATEICNNGIDDDCDPETTCFTTTHGGTTIDAAPFPGDEGVVGFYQYGSPNNASSNTGFEVVDRINQFLYEDPTDGKYYLVIFVDAANDNDGGNTTMSVKGAFGASITLMDDPSEGGSSVNATTGNGTLKWNWAPCCTDGAVIGPLTPPFCVTTTISSSSGIKGLSSMDGDQIISLPGAVKDPLTLCANP